MAEQFSLKPVCIRKQMHCWGLGFFVLVFFGGGWLWFFVLFFCGVFLVFWFGFLFWFFFVVFFLIEKSNTFKETFLWHFFWFNTFVICNTTSSQCWTWLWWIKGQTVSRVVYREITPICEHEYKPHIDIHYRCFFTLESSTKYLYTTQCSLLKPLPLPLKRRK